MWNRLRTAFRSIFRRDTFERGMDEELRFHIETLTDDLVKAGMPREEAARQARVAFGNSGTVKEECRRSLGLRLVDEIAQDVRYALRMIAKTPVVSACSVLLLALGIGANTAIFSAAREALFANLAAERPEELVSLAWRGGNPLVRSMSTYGYSGDAYASFSYSAFGSMRNATQSLTELFAFAPVSVRVEVQGDTDTANVTLVSGNYHHALGVPALVGRILTTVDDESAAPVAVISEPYWTRRFGRDPAAIGSLISLNGHAVAIVGVTPREYGSAQRSNRPPPDITVPLSVEPMLLGDRSRLDRPSDWWLVVMGRRARGTTVDLVQAELSPVLAGWAPPSPQDEPREPVTLVVRDGRRGAYEASSDERTTLTLFAAVFAAVLLIVAVNLTNVSLLRGEARRQEFALRCAVGASRWQLVRQLMIESLVVAGLAASLGTVVAFGLGSVLHAITAGDIVIRPDPVVFGFAALVAAGSAVVFGLLPAMRIARLAAERRRMSSSPLSAPIRFGRGMVVVQIALSVVLLVCAGLFLRTLVALQTAPIGFDASNLAFFRLDLTGLDYAEEHVRVLHEQVLARLEGLPGVESATLTSTGLLTGSGSRTRLTMEAGQEAMVGTILAHEGYFETLRIPLRAGRTPGIDDYNASLPVAVINESFANRFFPGADPIGRTFHHSSSPIQILGVVGDTKYSHLRDPAEPIWYPAHRRTGDLARVFYVRTSPHPSAVIGEIQRVVSEVDPALPRVSVSLQETEIEKGAALERTLALVSAIFGALALLVCSIGLFGLMAFVVTRRTKEIGIRMALGAGSARVLASVLRETFVVAAIGCVAGVAGALLIPSSIGSLLYGLEPNDGPTLVGAVLVMLVVAMLAALVPARRAASVDPLIALRVD